LRVFPDGDAKTQDDHESQLCPDVEYCKIAEAYGAHTEKVVDPADVPAALARCVAAVRGGRSAMMHVKVTPI
jgi:acetolactate synthase-1/2/3 large subunit